MAASASATARQGVSHELPATSPKGTFPFLDLPLELRMVIYDMIGGQAGIFPGKPGPTHSSHSLRILRQVNRQMRQDTDYLDNRGHLRVLCGASLPKIRYYALQIPTIGKIKRLTIQLTSKAVTMSHLVLRAYADFQRRGLNHLMVIEIDLLDGTSSNSSKALSGGDVEHINIRERDRELSTRRSEGFRALFSPYNPLLSLIEAFQGLERLEILGIAKNDPLWQSEYPMLSSVPTSSSGQAVIPAQPSVSKLSVKAVWHRTLERVRQPIRLVKRCDVLDGLPELQ